MKGQTIRTLVAACLMSLCVLSAPAQAGRMTPGERKVVKRINGLRASYGLRPVHGDRKLARAADAHSRDMLRADFFAHTSSNGTSPFERIRRYRNRKVVGETLAYMPRGSSASAKAVVNMWINSAPHLNVLTTRRFRRVGISKRRGELYGQRVTIWTADFSSRR